MLKIDNYISLMRDDDYEERVAEVLRHLRSACGNATAFHLSHVGWYLGQIRRNERLRPQDHAAVAAAMKAARLIALADLSPVMSSEDVERGFAAFDDLVQLWSEHQADREEWGDARPDAYDAARIFQNLCHNVDIERQIAARADKRRGAAAGLRQIGPEFVPGVDASRSIAAERERGTKLRASARGGQNL